MNGFTKEELEELLHCVYAYRDLCDEDVEDKLCDKIQLLINSYCDHEFLLSTDGENMVLLCSKCLKAYGTLNDNQ